jgi:hypothetical protein
MEAVKENTLAHQGAQQKARIVDRRAHFVAARRTHQISR